MERAHLSRKLRKKPLVSCENQTHDPLISSSDGLYSELLETLGGAGWKFNDNYTSHISNKMLLR